MIEVGLGTHEQIILPEMIGERLQNSWIEDDEVSITDQLLLTPAAETVQARRLIPVAQRSDAIFCGKFGYDQDVTLPKVPRTTPKVAKQEGLGEVRSGYYKVKKPIVPEVVNQDCDILQLNLEKMMYFYNYVKANPATSVRSGQLVPLNVEENIASFSGHYCMASGVYAKHDHQFGQLQEFEWSHRDISNLFAAASRHVCNDVQALDP